jgi:hypothetical protein
MGNEPHDFTTQTGVATKIEHLRLSNRHPERDILVIETSNGVVALFGYFGKDQYWHFMIVPPEFREEQMLAHVRNHLLWKHKAVLCIIPGDTINLTVEQVRSLPLYRPPSLHS